MFSSYSSEPTASSDLEKACKIISEVGIPSQPRILLDLNRMTANGDVDFEQVGDLVKKDVSLSAKVLRLAASPMFAGGVQFESITDALMILGFQFFKRCVLAASLEKAFSSCRYDMRKFWFHTSTISGLNQRLAQKYCPKLSEQAYTLGLFHDVGAVVLHNFKEAYSKNMDQAMILDFDAKGCEFSSVGSDHGSVGSIFSQKWALSQTIAEVIQFHHDCDYSVHSTDDARCMKAILQLSELLLMFSMNRGILALAPNEKAKEALYEIRSLLEIGESELAELKQLVNQVLSERF